MAEAEQVSSRTEFAHHRFERLFGKRLLVQLHEDPDRYHGLYLPQTHERMTPLLADVIQVGEDYPQDDTAPIDEGSVVLLTPWAGKTNNSYFWDDLRLIVNDYEVWCRVDEEPDQQAPEQSH